jgi:hypothetical protein
MTHLAVKLDNALQEILVVHHGRALFDTRYKASQDALVDFESAAMSAISEAGWR